MMQIALLVLAALLMAGCVTMGAPLADTTSQKLLNNSALLDEDLRAHNFQAHQYLYVWSGQNTNFPNAADFVAVVDWDPASIQYGHVVKIVSLQTGVLGVTQSGNEPHHCGKSVDGKYFVTGGLLSFLNGQPEIFVYEIPTAKHLADGPKLLYSLDPPGACTDAFVPVPEANNVFLISQMCNEEATSPGTVLRLDASTGKVTIKVDSTGLSGFNPHGFARYKDGSILVGDYIDPITLVSSDDPANIIFRDTVRYFKDNGDLVSTFDLPIVNAGDGVGQGNGFMDVVNIPGDKQERGFTVGGSDNQLYLVEKNKQPKLVFDLTTLTDNKPQLSGMLYTFTPKKNHFLFSMQFRYVVMMDITDPENPTVLQSFDFCSLDLAVPVYTNPTESISYSDFCAQNGNIVGTHFVFFPQASDPSVEQNRFVAVNYFLQFGMAQLAGTRTVHTFTMSDDESSFTLDENFNPNQDFANLWASPHSAIYVDDFE